MGILLEIHGQKDKIYEIKNLVFYGQFLCLEISYKQTLLMVLLDGKIEN